MRALFATAFLLPFTLAACSGSGDDADPGAASPANKNSSGVTPTKLVVDMSADDAGKICDYSAKLLGGYGKEKTCGSGSDTTTMTAPPDRASCVARSQSASKQMKGTACKLTVADLEVIARSFASCTAEPGFEDAFTRSTACQVPDADPLELSAPVAGFMVDRAQ